MIEFSSNVLRTRTRARTDCPSIDSCFIATPTRVSVAACVDFLSNRGFDRSSKERKINVLMNIHDRYVSNFRKDEKYFFLYNEVEQDFVDLFSF